jgi:hypothetical protein
MGIDYNATLEIGFVFKSNEVAKIFKKEIPEKFHLETRYDPKTGAVLKGKEKIIEREGYIEYHFKGKCQPDQEELFASIAQEIRCQYLSFGDMCCGPDYVVFKPNFQARKQYGYDDRGRHTIEGEIDVNAIIKMAPILEKLKTRLRKLGLKPRNAEVLVAHVVG